jgi:hypothetical protein
MQEVCQLVHKVSGSVIQLDGNRRLRKIGTIFEEQGVPTPPDNAKFLPDSLDLGERSS